MQSAFDSRLVALTSYTVQAFQVGLLSGIIDIEGWNFDLLIYDIVVDTNNGAFVLINLLLITIS